MSITVPASPTFARDLEGVLPLVDICARTRAGAGRRPCHGTFEPQAIVAAANHVTTVSKRIDGGTPIVGAVAFGIIVRNSCIQFDVQTTIARADTLPAQTLLEQKVINRSVLSRGYFYKYNKI